MSEWDNEPPPRPSRAEEAYGFSKAPLGGARVFEMGEDGERLHRRLKAAVAYFHRSPVGKELGYRFSVRKFKDKIYLERIK